MTMENAPQKLLVEALGTFALCFMGIGSVILTQGQDILAVALAHGLAIGLMVTAVGHISGGHFNPAVTLGMLVARRIEVGAALAYIAAQLVGAVLGAGALTLAYLDIDRNSVELGLPLVGSSIAADPAQTLSAGNAVVMEAILTFFLVLVIFGTLIDKRTGGKAVAGLAIGLTYSMGILAGEAVSGAAMNPARWFGPAVIQQETTDFLVWIIGPLVGGVAAALLYNAFLLRGHSEQEDKAIIEAVVAPSGERPAQVQKRRQRRRR